MFNFRKNGAASQGEFLIRKAIVRLINNRWQNLRTNRQIINGYREKDIAHRRKVAAAMLESAKWKRMTAAETLKLAEAQEESARLHIENATLRQKLNDAWRNACGLNQGKEGG